MQLRTRLKRLERLQQRTRADETCICFPSDEPPDLELKAEIEAARAVLCPLPGERFSKPAPTIYRALKQATHLDPSRWSGHSPQYVKAMEASFPSDRWPATKIVEPGGATRFVLKDGTEIHRLPPPVPVYDYQSGKIIGVLEDDRPKLRRTCTTDLEQPL